MLLVFLDVSIYKFHSVAFEVNGKLFLFNGDVTVCASPKKHGGAVAAAAVVVIVGSVATNPKMSPLVKNRISWQ